MEVCTDGGELGVSKDDDDSDDIVNTGDVAFVFGDSAVDSSSFAEPGKDTGGSDNDIGESVGLSP